MCGKKITSLYIDSEYRTTGTVSNFNIYTDNSGIRDVGYYAVLSVTVPFSWNTVRTGRNTLFWSATADGALNITLPDGNYSSVDMVAQLGGSMTAAATAGTYTATYDDVTQSFTITCAGDTWSVSQAELDASTFWDSLGFQSPKINAAAQTSDSAINITGDNRLYISSSKLANNDSYQMTTNQLAKSQRITSLQVSSNPGSVVQEYKAYPIWKEWPDANISNLDFQLQHENGDLVDLRGRQWQMTILLSSEL